MYKKRINDVLNSIYDDCQRYGKVTNLSEYSKTYGVTSNLGSTLKKLQILRYENGSYYWQRRKPDSAMNIQVRDELAKYAKKIYDAWKAKNNNPVSSASPIILTETQKNIAENTAKMNLDDLLTAFDMLPKEMKMEERKTIAKKMVNWKNQ